MKSVEALAQIRLNPATLDKFLLSALSLADSLEAPERDKVLLAAKEARSVALLIEHLRNLFSHQCCVETASQQQQQIFWPDQQAAPANEFQFQQAGQFESQIQFQHQFGAIKQTGSYRPAPGHQQQQQNQFCSDPNSQLFTYANKQTLFRAARSLASNVAKVLYLTDKIDNGSRQQAGQFGRPAPMPISIARPPEAHLHSQDQVSVRRWPLFVLSDCV